MNSKIKEKLYGVLVDVIGGEVRVKKCRSVLALIFGNYDFIQSLIQYASLNYKLS